jgi:hypothetical protein
MMDLIHLQVEMYGGGGYNLGRLGRIFSPCEWRKDSMILFATKRKYLFKLSTLNYRHVFD